MPIYVFRCEDCGEKFERLQKISAPDPDTCPHCHHKGTVRRQVTAPAFRLAGNGWYETDFKSDKEKKHNLAGDAARPSEGSADKSSDAAKGASAGKPATTPAAKEPAAKAAGD